MTCTSTLKLVLVICILQLILFTVTAKKKAEKKEDESQKWKRKDVRDYSDADVERLFDQWEDADEDELPEDELPEWKREPPKVDMSKLDPSNPENLLKETKKGRTLMMFATVSGNPSQPETEKVTQLWQGSLFNANIETQRYVVGENRVIFMLKDGSMAWEVKDYLVQQDRCEEVTIEGKSYPGKSFKSSKNEDTNKKSKENQKDNKTSDKKKKPEKKNDEKETNESRQRKIKEDL